MERHCHRAEPGGKHARANDLPVAAGLTARLRAKKGLAKELAALRLLDVAETAWDLHDLSAGVLHRAKGAFPHEPVRALDAMHLATAVQVSAVVGPMRILSLDERVRANAALLGVEVVPDRVT